MTEFFDERKLNSLNERDFRLFSLSRGKSPTWSSLDIPRPIFEYFVALAGIDLEIQSAKDGLKRWLRFCGGVEPLNEEDRKILDERQDAIKRVEQLRDHVLEKATEEAANWLKPLSQEKRKIANEGTLKGTLRLTKLLSLAANDFLRTCIDKQRFEDFCRQSEQSWRRFKEQRRRENQT